MNRQEYKEAYRNVICRPEWRARTEMIAYERGYRCESCGKYLPPTGEARNLQIHHSRYTAGLKPWLEKDENLHVLCRECHAKSHGKLSEVHAPHSISDLVNERMAHIFSKLSDPSRKAKSEEYFNSVRI